MFCFFWKILKLLFLSALLKDRYHKIPSFIESKLLPFQREGVRYVVTWSLFPVTTHKYGLVIVFSCLFVFSSLVLLPCIDFSYYLFVFRFILQHGGRVLLADEMGLGKTLQAIHCLKLNHFHTLSVHHDA